MIEGARGVLEAAGLGFSDIGVFVHGTTLATNAIIERKGARTALIATDGFRDVIEIADEGRFDQYDINIVKPAPLVPRELRFTVPERMDVHGAVRRPLDEGAVRAVAQRLASSTIEAVAVALIHAYANPAHEARVGEILAEVCPRVSVTLSSRGLPRGARVRAHLHGHRQRLRAAADVGLPAAAPAGAGRARATAAPIHLMTSGGSLASLETAARFPVRLVESGPAGGAILAGRIALERGERRILSFDMGGTTAKICLIDDGEPLKARAFEVDRQSRFKKGSGTPVRIPVIEMVEIGAGGGSIARVDALQRILVGPDSAGAEPGPACYGRGGTEPTVTDADLAIGKIDPVALCRRQDRRRFGQRRGGAGGGHRRQARRHGGGAGGRRRRRDRRREHGERRARACGGARRGASPSARWWRSAARRRCTRAGWPRSSASPASSCRRMRASARPSASWRRRRPTSSCARATCGSTTFDAEAANALVDAMQREAEAHARAAAGERPVSVKRSAFMRYAGQGHEITVALPDRPLTAATRPPSGPSSSASTRACSPATSPTP